ncbi:hypothetical protein psal_cds_644 [Pandoravirus salinus]|uniref:Uncharacterized protein n=1 Tax=Pandoravirus salinus TaxID=1349410 RepID=S4W275_9VIRU|nr:hypothetical protein psal_cds_644 [Pandoravirus salinus]AGO84542.1 hypothetical protein psal_cds_644 [Pandoravirus salinus]
MRRAFGPTAQRAIIPTTALSSASALQRHPSACRRLQRRSYYEWGCPDETGKAMAAILGSGIGGAWAGAAFGDCKHSCGDIMLAAARGGFFGAATTVMVAGPVFAFVMSPILGVVSVPVCATLGWLSFDNIVAKESSGA